MKILILINALIPLCLSKDERLDKGECIDRSDGLYSANKQFQLTIENDGNLVVKKVADSALIWKAEVTEGEGFKACMEDDGNFVLYDVNNITLWSSPLELIDGQYLYLQNNGLLTLKDSNEKIIWIFNGRSGKFYYYCWWDYFTFDTYCWW